MSPERLRGCSIGSLDRGTTQLGIRRAQKTPPLGLRCGFPVPALPEVRRDQDLVGTNAFEAHQSCPTLERLAILHAGESSEGERPFFG